MYSVDLVSDNAAFRALDAEWNEAVARSGVAHPFLRHEWFSLWWEAFRRKGMRLHVLVVRRHSRVCAIAPLMSEHAPMYGLPVRRLRFLQNDHTPRTDVIVADHPADSYRAIWHALHDTSGGWDVLQLSQLPEQSNTLEIFRRFAAMDGEQTGKWESGSSPYLTLPPTWDACTHALTSKLKQNIRNRLSRLSRYGQPQLEVIADPDEIRVSAKDAQRLEDSGWKTTEGTAIGSDACVQRFYTLLTEQARLCPWLRLLFLSVDGQRIATAYAAIYANRLFFVKTGYDPAFAQCSPFKLLTYMVLEHACQQGLSEVDFLGDSEPWKLEWTSAVRHHHWLFVFADTPRGRLLHPWKFQFMPAIRRLASNVHPDVSRPHGR